MLVRLLAELRASVPLIRVCDQRPPLLPLSLPAVLIDEVESLTAARKAAVSGSEPSDAVRVVNAVLTAIDALRTRPNVLLLTTSNVCEAIDVAFVDRAGGSPSSARGTGIIIIMIGATLDASSTVPRLQMSAPSSAPQVLLRGMTSSRHASRR